MFRYVVPVVVVAGLVISGLAVSAQPNKVAVFMDLKLARAQELLKGLALEDFKQIEKSSQAISLLCEEETWRVFQTPEYLAHSEQFRRTANAINKAAQEKNLDGAALGYVRMTMQCVECHKYVRDVRMSAVDFDKVLPAIQLSSSFR